MLSKFEKIIICIVFFAVFYGTIYHSNRPVFLGEFNTLDGSIYVTRFIDVIVSLSIFYFVSFYLIPKLVNSKKFLFFVLFSIFTIAIASIFEYGLDYVTLKIFNLPTGPNEFSDKLLLYPRRITYASTIIPGNIFIWILGILYGLSRDWISKNRKHNQLAHEKLKADIDFLRSQINPHFFFNALNNIYAINLRNKDIEGGEAIMKLSELMRYMIYDSNIEEISIEREIEQIENFIEIVRLKFAKTDPIDIQMTKHGSFSDQKIAPLILLPFVENAMKYGINSYGEGSIQIHFMNENNEFHFAIKNSKSGEESGLKKHSGIGLENVKKRLELLYTQRYNLKISETENDYSVQLSIKLKD